MRRPTKDERRLFREAVADVKPLAPGAKRSTDVPRVPRSRAVPRPRMDPATVHATLDLHGHSAEAARRRLQEFLGDATAQGLRRVRIVHGKGLRSGPVGPVLHAVVEHTLRASDEVEGFSTAARSDGGSGAVIVRLRAARRKATRS